MTIEHDYVRPVDSTIASLLVEYAAIAEAAAATAGIEPPRPGDRSNRSQPSSGGDASHIARLVRRLNAEFSPPLRPEQVECCLVDSIRSFETATVRNFLPVLIERAARDRLAELAESRGR
jgi:hypothetical protein